MVLIWPQITPCPLGGITHVQSVWLGGDVRGCLSAAGKITAPPLHTDEEIPTRPEEALQRCPQGHSQGLWAQVLPSYFFLRYLTQPFTSLHPHLPWSLQSAKH